jgi:hypothetical protein
MLKNCTRYKIYFVDQVHHFILSDRPDLLLDGSADVISRALVDESGAGVAQAVSCLTTGWTTGRSGFDPRRGQRIFPLASVSRPALGAHPASCTMGTGGPFPGGKARPGRDADHSPPSSAEVENE